MSTATERIEDLRVAWERDLEREIEASPRRIRSAPVDPGKNEPRVQLLPTMASRVHRIADLAAQRLGCGDPFVIYQTPRVGPSVAAQALLRETPFAIRLIGPVASVLDDEALAALIGHEVGHYLALGPRSKTPSLLLQAWTRGATDRVCTLGLLASELTADRFALLAAGGAIEAMVRLEIAIMTLDSPSALGARELDYLTESCRKVERHEVPLLDAGSYYRGYPTSPFRMFAAWLFWRSDLHHELTGRGPADLVLRDVDARLRAMSDEAIRRDLRPLPPHVIATRAPPDVVASMRPSPTAVAVEKPAVRAKDSRFHHEARAAISSVGAAVTGLVASALGRERREAPLAEEIDDPPDLDVLDDLEARFQALEREAGAASTAERATSLDDLEARFRKLEESTRKA